MNIPARIHAGLFVAVFAGGGYAQSSDLEHIAPKQVPEPAPGTVIEDHPQEATDDPGRDTVLVDALAGIVFTDDPDQIERQPQTEVDDIVIDGLQLPDKAAFKERFAEYLQQPVSLDLLDRINQDVIGYYRDHGVPVVDAFAPEGQDITSGVVQIVVLVGKLGKVRVEGARYFDPQKLADQVRLKRRETLSRRTLQADIRWLNNNPFRSVNLLLERGESFGKTDLVLKVEDRFPLRVYVGVEDSGTELTGEDRWLTGFNWGNAFGLDHQLGYQFTSSFDTGDIGAHTVNYVAPLLWRHTVSLFGAYIKSDPPRSAEDFKLNGKSWQIGARYNLPLPRIGDVRHDVSTGIDFKRSNNDLEFGTQRVFDTFTNIVQFAVGYNARVDDSWGTTGAGIDLYISPGDIGSDNEDAAFDASRAGASADYNYARINLNRVTRLPADYSWTVDLQLQVSDKNLLGSEQLGVGGYRSVRGYNEYEAVGDEGVILRNELRAPPMSLLKRWDIDGLQDNLQFLAFVDYGIVRNVDELPDEDSIDLLSTGIGLRYNISPYLTLRADYGWQLETAFPDDDKNSRAHVSLVVGY